MDAHDRLRRVDRQLVPDLEGTALIALVAMDMVIKPGA